jgi:hypothetical protein
LRSGYLLAAKIGNRCLEKSKYQLPTTACGTIKTNKMQLAIASSKLNHKPRSPIKCINRGEGCTKKLVFVHFVLTNKFTNNVFLSDKLEAYVCVDIIVNGRVVHIKARKFLALDNAF